MYQSLREVKEKIMTERLLLRAPKPGDGEQINRAVQSSMPELSSWLPFAYHNPTVDETESNTREAAAKFLLRENLRYLIFSKENGELIGSTGFHNIDWEIPKLEIGYWIDTKHSGKGYMLEAVHELTHYALTELRMARVEIQCDRQNKKSRAIPEKIGFRLEGTLINDDRSVDGKTLTDTCIYSMVSPSQLITKVNVIQNEEVEKEARKAFFEERWGSCQMILSTGVYRCDELNGFSVVKDGHIAGCITFDTKKQFEVISLDSQFEGIGIGTALMEHTEAFARSHGFSEIVLITTNDNLKAVQFYQKRGYRLEEIRRNAVNIARKQKPEIPLHNEKGIKIQDEWVLVKEIGK